ncbi:MAG: CapA family protein [Clostridiales bacterium]|nr:CapA family protein [Clostridiales bacterium]
MQKVLLWVLLFLLLPSLAAADTEITLTFGGDCVLGTREEWVRTTRNFEECIETIGMNWCFSGFNGLFSKDDLTLINLECALHDSNTGYNRTKQYTFCGKTGYTQMLTGVGIEAVNVANNHYIDYNQSREESTKAALEAAGVEYCGFQNLFVCEREGIKIGFGGCRETVFFTESKAVVSRDIQKLKEMGCDVIVYSCYWGREYSPTHNQKQETMAKYAAESGADIIVGTHPHVVQGIENLDGCAVLYSLGNLVFGGTHKMTTFDAMLARATLRFGDGGAYLGAQIKLLPVLTSGSAPENDFRPVLADVESATRILSLVQDDSALTVTQPIWFPARQEPL